MKDRVPVNPGRVLITPENGSAAYYATMTRADNPTQEGTPLNKNSLLKDSTAALFGLGVDAVPDDVLNAIKTLIDTANANANTKAKIATGSYTGTGSSGKNNKTSLTLDFAPRLIIVARNVMDTLEGSANVRQMDVMILHPAVGGFSNYEFTAGANNFYSVGSEVSGNTVSWWSKYPESQLNVSGKTYNYVAIG